MPREARSDRAPRSGVTDSCEPLDVGAGNKLGSSGRAACILKQLGNLTSPIGLLFHLRKGCKENICVLSLRN